MIIYRLQELGGIQWCTDTSCQVTAFSDSLLKPAFSNPANSSTTPKLTKLCQGTRLLLKLRGNWDYPTTMGVRDMSKPRIIDPDREQLAPGRGYLGKGGGRGVLNGWNPLPSGGMVPKARRSAIFGWMVPVVAPPRPCCSGGGGRAPHGHTTPLVEPDEVSWLLTQDTWSSCHHSQDLPCPATAIPYQCWDTARSCLQSLNRIFSLCCHPGKETPENSRASFSAIQGLLHASVGSPS